MATQGGLIKNLTLVFKKAPSLLEPLRPALRSVLSRPKELRAAIMVSAVPIPVPSVDAGWPM